MTSGFFFQSHLLSDNLYLHEVKLLWGRISYKAPHATGEMVKIVNHMSCRHDLDSSLRTHAC